MSKPLLRLLSSSTQATRTFQGGRGGAKESRMIELWLIFLGQQTGMLQGTVTKIAMFVEREQKSADHGLFDMLLWASVLAGLRSGMDLLLCPRLSPLFCLPLSLSAGRQTALT
jgi:hypothetical protein